MYYRIPHKSLAGCWIMISPIPEKSAYTNNHFGYLNKKGTSNRFAQDSSAAKTYREAVQRLKKFKDVVHSYTIQDPYFDNIEVFKDK